MIDEIDYSQLKKYLLARQWEQADRDLFFANRSRPYTRSPFGINRFALGRPLSRKIRL